jgi:uncharacterized phage protein (TIGR02218 family)
VTDSRVTQAARIVVEDGDGGSARVTQAARLTIGAIAPPVRSTQAVRLAVAEGIYPLRMTQLARIIVSDYVPCVTRWQQCWIITRRDGVVFRYTSLDVDFTWGDNLYKSCGSLNPSAAEDASALGQVGNQELEGIFSDDGIKEAELYGGLFDDAFVEVWLVPYEGDESARRLAAGWTGNLRHGEKGFNLEVVGPGARIDQQALVQVYTPGCRWTFGDSRCQYDREAHRVQATITHVFDRGRFVAEIDANSAGDADDLQWENGLAQWTSGENVGRNCEVKAADFASAGVTIELWELAGLEPQVGDTFDLLPGCDLSKATCKNVYDNVINFGGFDRVPGQDSVVQTPDAKLN